MRIRMQAINYDLWEIVENGYTIQQPNDPNSEAKANLQLDAQEKDIICCSLSRGMFIQFRDSKTAQELWDGLRNVHNGIIL